LVLRRLLQQAAAASLAWNRQSDSAEKKRLHATNWNLCLGSTFSQAGSK
jgi:hypothetical protein